MNDVELTLFGYWRSSSSWRVRIALNLKSIRYTYRAVHLVRDGGEQHQADYVKKNPLAEVPLLQVTELGKVMELSQSVAMIEWLEERFPEPSLFPQSYSARARAREIAEICNSAIQPFHNLRILKAVEVLGASRHAWVAPHVTRGLTAVEALVAAAATPFAVGDLPSVADVCIIPQLYAARRFEIDLEPFPVLRRIEASCMELEAFNSAHPDHQPDAPKES